jgi:hypothetical protein
LFNYTDKSEYVEIFEEKFAREAKPGALFLLAAGHKFMSEKFSKYFIEKSECYNDPRDSRDGYRKKVYIYVFQRNDLPYKA